MNIKYRQTCRICGNPHLTPVIDLGNQYFQGSFIKEGVPMPPTRKTPNVVVRCDTSKYENACGLVQTLHTIPPRILYTNYWYQSGISATMRGHLQGIVNTALEIFGRGQGIQPKTVLDIASNDNTLLRRYPDSVGRYGVDPSDIAAKQNDPGITVISDLFPTKLLKVDAFDVVTSIACFYDIENPKVFAQEVKNILTNEGIWVFEVAYWKTMVENLAYDSIVNEHINHYHLAPIEQLMQSVGLKVFDAKITTTNGGSIMCFVCLDGCDVYDKSEYKKRLSDIRLGEFNAALDEEDTYVEFRAQVAQQRAELRFILETIKEQGKTVHILGASTKLNTILGYCGIGPELIEYAAERSPEKHGAKTISGIKIISEEESRAMKPNFYLIGPYHFKNELVLREQEFTKNGGKFIFPLPKLEII